MNPYCFLVLAIAALLICPIILPIILSRKAKQYRIIVLIFALFAELSFAAFAVSAYDTVCCTEEAVGTIENIREEIGAKCATSYYAEIIYEVDGQTYREEARLRWLSDFSKRNYNEGDHVALLYNPAHPDRVIVKSLRILVPTEYFLLAALFSTTVIHTIKKTTHSMI